MKEPDQTDRLPLTRRKLLSAGVGTATALAGLGALAGSAAAWEDLNADFRGCSEVWITVGENDFACLNADGEEFDGPNDSCPLRVAVIVADGRAAYCVEVDVSEETATRIPGQFGDQPVVKYRVDDGKKIIGVMGLAPSGGPVEADLIENTNRCAQTPATPSVYDAPCVPDKWGDGDDGTQESRKRGRGRGHGPP